MSAPQSLVQLIPWDPDSPSHVERLFEQRLQCGWNMEKVKSIWRDDQRAGSLCIYWIVIPAEDPQREEKLRLHLEKYPTDKDALQDTSASVRGVKREPSHTKFIPVGHISLAPENTYSDKVDLDLPSENVYWIKTFYVSRALRNKRIGTAAMQAAEAMATDEPLCARTLALDTTPREDQMREDIAKAFYGGVPKVANQDWYEKMGYRPLKTVRGLYTSPDRNGVVWDLRTIFMRKDIY